MTTKISPNQMARKEASKIRKNSLHITSHHHTDREKPLRSTRRNKMSDQNFSVVGERIVVECKTLVTKKHKVNSDLCKLIGGLLNGKSVDDAISEWNKVLIEVGRVIRTDKRFAKNQPSLKRVTKRLTARVTNVLRYTMDETITIPETYKKLLALTDKIKSNPSRGKWDTKTGGFIKEGTQKHPAPTPETTPETTTSTLDNEADDTDREKPVTISETTEETTPEEAPVIALKGKAVTDLIERFESMTRKEASAWAVKFSTQIDKAHETADEMTEKIAS